jgi:glycosyltransferase involved in cell wall biosynthesis
MKRILWLASWYPSKVDMYTGDFIERHARAASSHNHIDVLHIVRVDRSMSTLKISEERIQYAEGGGATIIYYRSPSYRVRWVDKIVSNFLYFRLHNDFIKKYIRENGKPDGLHVHTGMKAGAVALFFKHRYGLSYLVSEHWTGLCPEANPNFNDKSWSFRWLWKTVVRNASGCSAVSIYLADAMKKRFSPKKMHVIPNVVDGDMFYPSDEIVNRPQFIHISTLKNAQKNVFEILEAAALMASRIPGFKLIICGQPDELVENYAHSKNLEAVVEFKGLCSQQILREYIQQSMALVLYSRFETFGCVIIEANACGKPVIVSDIPVLHENVKAGLTGAFVPLNNPVLLADAMVSLAEDAFRFDSKMIRDWAMDHYSFEKIGKQFALCYEACFKAD